MSLQFLVVLIAIVLGGCLSSGVKDVDADPDFSWDAMKRDQILMTPLVDLRDPKSAPDSARDLLKFYDRQQCLSYAESFKQAFFKLRKDIRVFGAGGAFENLSAIDNMDQIVKDAITKRSLAKGDADRIRQGSQEIRYVFFFAITGERLKYGVQSEFREDQEKDLIHYSATRFLEVTMGLWDSQKNRTVWLAREQLAPTQSHSVAVTNPRKYRQRKVKNNKVYYVWVGPNIRVNLSRELRERHHLFPGFPGRSPAFESSFERFALALPIHPSEDKWIEYNHFTHHKPYFGGTFSQLGSHSAGSFELGFSSNIYKVYRWGGFLAFPMIAPLIEEDGSKKFVDALTYGLTFDWENSIGKDMTLGLGTAFGGIGYVMREEIPDTAPAGTEGETRSDGALIIWPRAQLVFGERLGVQWSLGLSYRYFYGLEDPILTANKPSPWNLRFGVGYVFRGY